jgi:heme/copper-type cytochrome/quinol oxidase subunit 4
MGLAFSVALSEPPPSGARDWIEVLLIFLAFAGLPLLAAFVMFRRMRSRLYGGMLVAVAAWTVLLTCLLCFGIYALLWNVTVGA